MQINKRELTWEECEPKRQITTVKCRNSSRVRVFNGITSVNALRRIISA